MVASGEPIMESEYIAHETNSENNNVKKLILNINAGAFLRS